MQDSRVGDLDKSDYVREIVGVCVQTVDSPYHTPTLSRESRSCHWHVGRYIKLKVGHMGAEAEHKCQPYLWCASHSPQGRRPVRPMTDNSLIQPTCLGRIGFSHTRD
jgi:hypothetical protein